MKCIKRLVVVLAVSLAGICSAGPQEDLWPMFRHDSQLTGVSPLEGNWKSPPAVAWEVSLDPPLAQEERVRAVDLDADGLEEILVVRRDGLTALDRRGKTLWVTVPLDYPEVTETLDLTGEGGAGILLWAREGPQRCRFVVSGATGHAVKLYGIQNVFRQEERLGKVLPGVPGLQLCAWWSGEPPDGVFDEQIGHGFLFSFENGLEHPHLRFQQEPRGVIYAPRHFFADYDQDGETEMVMVTHQQAFFYDVQKNALELAIQWPQIRTYTATLTMRPAAPGLKPSLLSINPHIPGVERVDIVEGKAKVVWREVVGGVEDQYQTKVKIAPGAPGPFLDLRGDGRLLILASVTNEHQDGKPHLLVLDAASGKRLFDAAELQALSADDLDADGVPELIARQGTALVILDWRDETFQTVWREEGAQPLLAPLPREGDLSLSNGGNQKLWRERPGSREFLLNISGNIYACLLQQDHLQQMRQITQHEALGNVPPAVTPHEVVEKQKGQVRVLAKGQQVYQYEARRKPRYLAPPPVVGVLDGAVRVLVRDAEDKLLSLNSDGGDKQILAERLAPDAPRIIDVDGDAGNEVVAGMISAAGSPFCAVLDAHGKELRRFEMRPGATAMKIGPMGRLSGGKHQWLAVYFDMPAGARPGVAIYNAATGEELWFRDHFEKEASFYGKEAQVKFVLHVPTAVYDYNGDGADDLVAASENFYGILDIASQQPLTPITVFSDCVPGHWQAYASPIVARLKPRSDPQVFHHKAFAQTILTTLQGLPVWHYGLTRDTTASAWPGIADLDGDGTREIVQSRIDGLVRVFAADADDKTCPACSEHPLQAENHAARILAETTLAPPLSDFATLNADGGADEEAIVGTGNGKLVALKLVEHRLSEAWSMNLEKPAGSPVIADLDASGTPELLVSVEDGRLLCLK